MYACHEGWFGSPGTSMHVLALLQIENLKNTCFFSFLLLLKN
jgi:hypothetical protein